MNNQIIQQNIPTNMLMEYSKQRNAMIPKCGAKSIRLQDTWKIHPTIWKIKLLQIQTKILIKNKPACFLLLNFAETIFFKTFIFK